jgi:hypothetical protein
LVNSKNAIEIRSIRNQLLSSTDSPYFGTLEDMIAIIKKAHSAAHVNVIVNVVHRLWEWKRLLYAAKDDAPLEKQLTPQLAQSLGLLIPVDGINSYRSFEVFMSQNSAEAQVGLWW